MTGERVEQLLVELGKEGTELNKDYQAWRDDNFSGLMFDVMFHLSTPDKASTQLEVANVGENGASLLLGFCTGMAKGIDQIQSLDTFRTEQKEEPETTFESQDEE